MLRGRSVLLVQLALGQLKIASIPRVVRIAQDIEEPRSRGDQQATNAALDGVRERGTPCRPAVWRRARHPALRFAASRYAYEDAVG